VEADDPAVIVALAGLPLRALYNLAVAIGHSKFALAGELGDDRHARRRVEWYGARLREQFGEGETWPRAWAEREVQRLSATEPHPRRRWAFLGLMTMARLLSGCEPFRARWALQHLPYPIAKRFRSIISSPIQPQPQLLGLEGLLLKIAWQRLTLEKRLPVPYPEETTRPNDVP
jgi:hypothetical protein